jgi:hypothetical protein
MNAILDSEIIDLPATRSYKRRELVYTPGDRPGEGTAVLTLWKGLRAGSTPERDTYRIEEEDAVGVMGRSFLVLNVHDDEQPDVYRTTVGPVSLCTCKAGLCKVPTCKHRDALAAAIAAGLL